MCYIVMREMSVLTQSSTEQVGKGCGDSLKEGEGSSHRRHVKGAWSRTTVWGWTVEVGVRLDGGGPWGKNGSTVIA